MFVLIVDVTRWALSDVMLVILDIVVSLAGCGRGGVGTKRFAVVPAQIINAHLHSVDARIETLGALVHICDNMRRTTIPQQEMPQRLDRLITKKPDRHTTRAHGKVNKTNNFPRKKLQIR